MRSRPPLLRVHRPVNGSARDSGRARGRVCKGAAFMDTPLQAQPVARWHGRRVTGQSDECDAKAARRVDDGKPEEGRPGGARRGRAWLCWQAQRAAPAVPARRRQGWKPEGARQAQRRLDAQHDSPARLGRGRPLLRAADDHGPATLGRRR